MTSNASMWRYDVDNDTMSATMKPAKEFYELDVGQPNAESQLVTPSDRRLVTCGRFRPAQGGAEYTEERVCGIRGVFRPAQGGADDTEERVCCMVSLFDVFPRQAVESNALSTSRPRRTATWRGRGT